MIIVSRNSKEEAPILSQIEHCCEAMDLKKKKKAFAFLPFFFNQSKEGFNLSSIAMKIVEYS